MTDDPFFDRFTHPWLARFATVGGAVWLVSFLVAAAGLGVEATGRGALGASLFLLSGVVGLLGILVLGACACWLLGVWLRRELR